MVVDMNLASPTNRCRRAGRVWLIASVLKTEGGKTSVGSNPTPSSTSFLTITSLVCRVIPMKTTATSRLSFAALQQQQHHYC